MTRTVTLMLTLCLIALAAGCSEEDIDKATDKVGDAAKKVGGTLDGAKTKVLDELEDKMQGIDVESLKEKVGSASGATKAAAQGLLDKLVDQKSAAGQALDKLKGATGDNWTTLLEGARTALANLGSTYEKLVKLLGN